MKELFYEILDILTLRKGVKRTFSGYHIRIPTRYFRYFESDYETANISFINDNVKSGMTVIDGGAHIGLLTSIMAEKVAETGKVYSFEPTPSTFEVLEKTISVNNLKKIVTPINNAISDKVGKTTFYITEIDAHNSNSLANNERLDGKQTSIDVDLTSIDEFVKDEDITRIDFIKFDVEGAEYSALKGAQKVIKEHQPKIILALHPNAIKNFGDSLPEIWDFINDCGYKVIDKNKEITKDYFIKQTGLFDVFLVQ